MFFQNENIFRRYYRCSHHDLGTGEFDHEGCCYAESGDGIHWSRPEFNLFEFGRTKRNNIVWVSYWCAQFCSF
ncbi:MAG: hypothetical protein NC911_05080 [Candidatus Omnitrophica bacterium]|nr:hypothetical protein [Candidatus Omnitrophota bacterium]